MKGQPARTDRSLLAQSMRLAGGLALLKIVSGMASGSLGVLSSALDSILDVTASAVNYVSMDVSGRPPDKGHPYGHGKAEALAGLFQGAFIAASGGALLAEAIRRLMQGARVEAGAAAVGAMAVSIVASAVHSRRLRRAARESGSTVMKTEEAHYTMDVLSNSAILGALLLVRGTGSSAGDLIISLSLTGYILKKALVILVGCVQELMDHGLSSEQAQEVERVIRTHHPSVAGFHTLRARTSGGQTFVDFHLILRDVARFSEAHQITESLIDKIRVVLPGADVTVHYDPEGER